MQSKIDKYIKKIKKDGYAIIPNLISVSECEKFKNYPK